MHWDGSLRDAFQQLAPLAVWVVAGLALSTLVALIRDSSSRLLRDSCEQLKSLRSRILIRSAIKLGRKARRFWQARQHEPARTVAEALDRLAEALPKVGSTSLPRVTRLQAELDRQLSALEKLGLQSLPRPVQESAEPGPMPKLAGSWGKLIILMLTAGLAGLANSFLLNEFFQGVIAADALFPASFPDLRVSHVFAALIFMMEVAIGFALHHFAAEGDDDSAARRFLASAPWLVLGGLVCLEVWAYALLSYQIDIPRRLSLAPDSSLYTFARYFLALFGAGLTLLLASLGYLLGHEAELLRIERSSRRHRVLLSRYARAIHTGADHVERTERALARLGAAVRSFPLELVHQFKREVDATGSAENLQAALRDAVAETLEALRPEERRLRGRLDHMLGREPGPVRTESQALAGMVLLTVAMLLLGITSWLTIEYVAGFAAAMQSGGRSPRGIALGAGVVMTSSTLAAGALAGQAFGGSRSRSSRRLLQLLATVLVAATTAGLVALAIANRTLGASTVLNGLFGLIHAGILGVLGLVLADAVVSTLHLLQLVGIYLAGRLAWLGALILSLARVLLLLMDWAIRLVSVFGQLVVRPRPPVRYGAVEVSSRARTPREVGWYETKVSGPPYPGATRETHG